MAALVPFVTRRVAAAVLLALAAWVWGSLRLDALDASALRRAVGTAERAVVIVSEPPRAGRFDVRVFARMQRWGTLPLDEPVLLKLPRGRAPPEGTILELVGTVKEPRGPSDGFDERAWLRGRGVHAVVRVSTWRTVGRRGGAGGALDSFRRYLRRWVAPGLTGDRGALIQGVVLGDDTGVSEELEDRFRASGLYHLLAVSGQNVALVAGGVLIAAWVVGVPRLAAQLAALFAIVAYVFAVGLQPSVVRAGVTGVLGSLAWLTARASDRWHFLLVAAVALLGWNPYTLLDPGFELSFAAVLAIFVVAPRIARILEGYPLPARAREPIAISSACALATAPIAWIHFHAVSLVAVPANVFAAPAVVPVLAFGLVTAAVSPLSTSAAAALAWLNGWCAAYLAACARVFGGLPAAQIRSGRAVDGLVAVAFLVAAYRWPRGEGAPSRVPDHRQRPAEDPARASPPP